MRSGDLSRRRSLCCSPPGSRGRMPPRSSGQVRAWRGMHRASFLPTPRQVTGSTDYYCRGSDRDVSADAPLLDPVRSGGGVDDVPVALAGPPHGEVGLAVSVVVAGHGDVTADAPLLDRDRSGGGVDDVPVALAGPPHGEVGLAVSVVVAGHGDVTADAPLLDPVRSGGGVDDVPVALARSVQGDVGNAGC